MNKIKGGVIPTGFIPAVEKGIVETMRHGTVAGYPVEGVRVTLYDGSYHSVDSSEMAFKVAGSMAFKQAMESAKPVLLEPIMTVTVTVPEDCVGDVIGDLNSRRGRPLGMEPKGQATEVRPRCRWPRCSATRRTCARSPAGRATTPWSWRATRRCPAHLAGRVVEKAQADERGREGLASIAAVKKELRPFHDHVTCDVCGRTILKGERTEAFLAPGGERHAVCELCFVRAEHAGWIRESAHEEMPARGPRPQEREPLLARLRRRPSGPLRRPPEPAVEADVGPPPETGRRSPAPPRERPAGEAAGPPPRARGAHHRRGQGGSRAGAVQLLRAPAHRRGAGPQPRHAVGHRAARIATPPAR